MKRIIVLGLILTLLTTANAYTISRNRTLRVGNAPPPSNTSTTTTMQPIIILDQETIRELNNLRPRGEAWAYQAAYQDALKDVRIVLGLKTGAYSTAPAYPRNVMAPEFQTCYCYNKTYADFIKPYLGNLTQDPAKFNFTLWKK
jgi:hypothetical protein